MMKAKLLTTLVLVIFVATGLSFSHHQEKVDAGPIVVPILIGEDLAKNAARNFLDIRANLPQGGMPEWKGATLSSPVTYYCPTGKPAAYCFSVIKDGKDLGHILVSADKTRPPIQEFSRAPAPHQRTVELLKRVARVNLKEGQRLGEPIIIYPGLGMYFTVFPVLEGEKKVDRVVFCTRGLFPLPREILKLKVAPPTQRMAEEAEKIGNILKKKDLKLPELYRYSFKYLDNVPIYPHLISCHPAVTAALLDYWGLREEGESKEEFIAEVARNLREEINGLIIHNIPRRVEEVARGRGYELQVTLKCRSSLNPEEVITFAGYKEEIAKGHPPILIFSLGPGAGKDLSRALIQMAHFPSVGVGYSSDPTGNYLIVHEALFAHEQAEDIVPGEHPWARTGVTFYNWQGRADNIIVVSVSKPEQE